ncbi:MAG: 1-acyl-sn-glycerol-3-phosphate acyltransferase [Planctomycetes bacterium]|nr:1-acyl-sn-glycerol-3-phosphate acyltransferase [Planctomycetota bacterium]
MKWWGVAANNLFKCATWTFFKTCFRLRVEGAHQCPRRGGLIIVANHVSHFDPPLLGSALPRALVYTPRATLKKSRIYRMLTALLDLEHVERDGRDIGATRRLVERLRAGDAVALFPEQTRSEDGCLKPLSAGFAMLAALAEVPVLPVVIDGAFEAWPRGQKRPHLAGRITVRVGAPIAVVGSDRKETVARVERALRELGARVRAPASD